MALEIVAHRIVDNWKMLAWQLAIPEESIQCADSNNPKDVVGKAKEVLRVWKEISGLCASWAEVENALTVLERKDIVDCKNWLEPSYTSVVHLLVSFCTPDVLGNSGLAVSDDHIGTDEQGVPEGKLYCLDLMFRLFHVM